MLSEKLEFEVDEKYGFDTVELRARYDISVSAVMGALSWKQQDERQTAKVKSHLTEQLRKVITADMLDEPYLRYLHTYTRIINILANAIEREAFKFKHQGDNDEVKDMLYKIAYDLRTKSELR